MLYYKMYNGIKKLTVNKTNFMTHDNILKAIKLIKIKNSEGHDMIPQRIIFDGISFLTGPLTELFNIMSK